MNSFNHPQTDRDEFEHDNELRQHLINVEVSSELIGRWKSAIRSATLPAASLPAAFVPESTIVPEKNSATDVVVTRGSTSPRFPFSRRTAFLALAASVLICVIGAWNLWPAASLASLENALVAWCEESELTSSKGFQSTEKPASLEIAHVLSQLRVGSLSEGQFTDSSNRVEWKIVRIQSGSRIGFLCSAKVKGIDHLPGMLALPSEQKSGVWKVAHCKSDSHLVVFVHQGELSKWLQPHA